MISSFEEIKELLEQIDAQLQSKVKVYAIGGLVLLYQKLKPATKDLDLVTFNPEDYNKVRLVLRKLGFEETKPEFGYEHFNLSQIMISKNFRIDLFSVKVCGGFSLSKKMTERAKEIFHLKNLTFYLCSNEDIFLFKNMTERDGDITDCISLATTKLDWNIILEELNNQIQASGNKVWITWVGERFDLLQEKGLDIPIMKEVDKLREEYYEDFLKRIEK
ncbi:MAG: DUF6036 family nucleotidyltransferase [Candidatus Woesearchaeota archaeon]